MPRSNGAHVILTCSRYERFERVDQGDFNWITPEFVALASPQHKHTMPIPTDSPLYETVPKTREEVKQSDLPEPFKNVLRHFSKRNVGMVVRLNSELYSPTFFTAIGIEHTDMQFDDGTCPPLPMVKKFIRMASDLFNVRKQAMAVHCKAGLGRTGCLIGAYLIYRHGFSANEIIAFMRFMRPGMVVGPQQHWLHLNQGTFREWWWEDQFKQKLAAALPSTPTKTLRKSNGVNVGQAATPPNATQSGGKRSALGELNHNETVNTSVMDENLPAPTPGQPRKGSRIDSRHHPYARAPSTNLSPQVEDKDPDNQVVEMHSYRQSQGHGVDENEEQWEHRVLGRRTSSKSPVSSEKRRAVSYTTTTTTTSTRYSTAGDDEGIQELTSDVENWTSHDQPDKTGRPKTPASTTKSGSGSGSIGVVKMRGSPVRRSGESREVKNAGVRKTSARVGSTGASRSRS